MRYALLLCIAYFVFQAMTLDYGTTINDIPYIRDAQVRVSLEGTALERSSVIEVPEELPAESLDKRLMRFKLYSVEADEVYSIMGLSRIKPHLMQFDPHF